MQWQFVPVSKNLCPFFSSPGLWLFVACHIFTSVSPRTTGPGGAISSVSRSQPISVPVKCKNEQGNDVDWFIAYKLPKNRTSQNPIVRRGVGYAFILPGEAESGQDVNLETRGDNERSFPPGYRVEGQRETRGHTSAAWTLSEKGIDSPESMVGQTIGELYNKDGADTAFLTYNDQPPVGPTVDSGGHTKGIIITSLASGIWIQHSVPHFPLIAPNYQYPPTGLNNGQVFHCISLPSAENVDDLAKILEITKPHVVNFSFPTDSLKTALPQLSAIVKRHKMTELPSPHPMNQSHLDLDHNLVNRLNPQHRQKRSANATNKMMAPNVEAPCTNEVDERACHLNSEHLGNNDTATISGTHPHSPTTLNGSKPPNWALIDMSSGKGQVFHAFVKGPSFNQDIYSDWIAPTYKTKLVVQSWLNGPNPFPSNCTTPSSSVYNIEDTNIAGHLFSTHRDHSKWTVSTEKPLVCISDLNRMEHQLKRGGVAICFMDSAVWATFNNSVIDIQPCPRLLGAHDGVISSPQRDQLKEVIAAELDMRVAEGRTAVVVQDEKIAESGMRSRGERRKSHLRKVKSRTFSFAAI